MAALVPCGLIASVASGCGGSTDTDGKGSGGSAGSGGTSVGSGGSGAGAGGSVSSGGAGGGTGGSAGAPGGSAGAYSCDYGTPAEQCFTLDELEQQLNSPPQGGDVPADAGVADAWIEVTDCLPKEQVQDSCCNSPTYGPQKQGEQCCYVFCTGACCGRAFVIDGSARVAGVTRRSDWMAEGADDAAASLDATTARALAASWLEDAQMEHASIASFARFTLELLGCGAPPELVFAAQQASLDEIEHARLCFAQAARFAGEPLGPTALDVGGAELSRSLVDCAVAAFNEGCIGETIAALTARAQLAHATDEQVGRALGRIADDEERHAELAWRFVAWAIRHGGPAVGRAIESALSAALATPRAALAGELAPGVDARAWQRFGRLGASEAAALANSALVEVIKPCVRALVAEPEASLPAAV